jgi:hypothetical protein
MNRFILSIMIVTLALAFSRTSVFAQAAAESVLLNANSATATAKAGSALGSVLNHVNQQLGGQVQQVTHPALGATSQGSKPASTGPDRGSAIRSGTGPAAGNLITSIDGAASTSCVPTTPPSATSDKAATQSTQANCGNNSSSKPTPKYKSVMTVSFPN